MAICPLKANRNSISRGELNILAASPFFAKKSASLAKLFRKNVGAPDAFAYSAGAIKNFTMICKSGPH